MKVSRDNLFSFVPINKVENFWDCQPCNIKHSCSSIGSKDYFDEVEQRKYFVEPHIPEFAEFSKWSGKKVLEIGCGIGTDTINFAKVGADVTAVDLSGRSLDLAQTRAKVFSLPVRFYKANTEHLSEVVPVVRYDLVYSFGVLHHTPNPLVALKEIRKYMGRDSILKIMIYHRFSWKVFTILLMRWWRFWEGVDKVVARYSEAQTGCPVTYTYSKRLAKNLLEEGGFEVIEMSVEHIFPYIVRYYKRYVYKKHWYFRILPDRLFRWLEKNIGWHLCITAKLRN